MPTVPLPDSLQGALVVAVDDSPPAREALHFAAQLATALSRPLAVVTVWNYVNTPRPGGAADGPPVEAVWQAEVEQRLDALLREECGADVALTPLVVHGNTTPVLLAVSARAAHLVVGSRGRGGFVGLMLGSTSDQLVRHAECPITVVRSSSTTA